MKKIILLLAASFIGVTAYAQTQKELDQFNKKLSKSDQTVLDAQKVPLIATWIDRATVLAEAATFYTSKLIPGFPTDQLFPMLTEQPSGVTEVDLGAAKKKYTFTNFDLYTDANDNVVSWMVKKEIKPNALDEAFEALVRAKNINENEFDGKAYFAVEKVWNEYSTNGSNFYYLGEKAKAAEQFKKAVATKALRNDVDSILIYQAGVAYLEANQEDSALLYLNRALEIGYDMDGDVQFYLAHILQNKGNLDKAIAILEEAVTTYSDDSRIVMQLVKLYIDTNKDPDKIISILESAKALDPDNISLYMVEGEMWNRLGEDEKSAAAFAQVVAKDPTNVLAFKNVGILQYDLADEINEKARKADANNDTEEYEALTQKAKATYANAIEMLEKVHELDPKDEDVIGWLRELYYYQTDQNIEKNQERFQYYNKLYNEL